MGTFLAGTRVWGRFYIWCMVWVWIRGRVFLRTIASILMGAELPYTVYSKKKL